MSYSVCLECKEMVSQYEKYCQTCARSKRSNPPDFWKNHDYSFLDEPKRSAEIYADQFTEDDYVRMKEAEMVRFQFLQRGASPTGNRKERRRYEAMRRGK